ncbi:MAG: MarC family protein [Bacteroidetes bacterium]|nr:MarC family protein [Bacteroidota bacterium]MCZ6901009.1 MarC family protein [Bacteroidota bacterium]
MFSFKEIISVSLILFSVIDIVGNIPIIIDLRKKAGQIESEKATLVSGFIMVLTLFVGESILAFFGIDIESFAVAGAIIIFLIGMEMILERNIFKSNPEEASTTSIVPLAFPMIAGAATMTTIISLRAEYTQSNVLVGIILNLGLIYLVLKTSGWLERKIGQAGFNILRKVFGIILLSIAIKLFKTNIHILA